MDDIGGIGAAEDLHLPEDLAAEGSVAVAVDYFERVDCGGALVAYFVDRAAVAVAEDLEPLEVRGGCGGGGSCGGVGGWREG